MFCPRCGRPVNAEANFCGGCGLSKIEIEKYLSKTAPQQPAQETPQQDCSAAAEQPQTAQNGHVFRESETVKAEEPAAEKPAAETTSSYAENNCTYAYSYNKTHTTAEQPYYSTAAESTTSDAAFTAASEEIKKEAPLTTVDFIWMLVLSSLPVIGLIYIIYLAVQNNNINKRSFARATLIVSLFAFVVAFVFMIGVALAGAV